MAELETIDPLLEQFRALDSKPDGPVSIIYHIGMPLIAAGYSQEMILNALFYLAANTTETIAKIKLR